MPNPHHYALVVGINYYPGVSDLRCPVEDAKAFGAWLREEGGVPEENIVTILGDKDSDEVLDAEPTRDRIDKGFRRLNQLMGAKLETGYQAWPESRLYVFLSGHGVAPTADEVALLMANAGSDAWPHLPCNSYVRYYMRSQYFREVVVFADCCRNAKEIEISAPPFAPRFGCVGATNYVVGYATGDDTSAFEPQAGSPSSHSYFTGALLEALRGANVAGTGQPVTDQTVADYVQNVVPLRSPQQQAHIRKGTPERIVFTPGPSAVPTIFSVTILPPAAFVGTLEIWSAAGTLLASWDSAPGPHESRLPPGLYEVRREGEPDGSQFASNGLFRVSGEGLHVQL